MAISLPYTIVNGDPVDAGPVEANYQTIERYTNQEVIQRNGAVAMTAQLKLVGSGRRADAIDHDGSVERGLWALRPEIAQQRPLVRKHSAGAVDLAVGLQRDVEIVSPRENEAVGERCGVQP